MQGGAHLDRPLLSIMTSARSMFCVLAAKASLRFCHVQLHGRLCTTTCGANTIFQGSTWKHTASCASEQVLQLSVTAWQIRQAAVLHFRRALPADS